MGWGGVGWDVNVHATLLVGVGVRWNVNVHVTVMMLRHAARRGWDGVGS